MLKINIDVIVTSKIMWTESKSVIILHGKK
jgi:hypothetical protein